MANSLKGFIPPAFSSDGRGLLSYIDWHENMAKLDNDGLARALLRSAPLMGRHAELCDLVAERLSPGVLDRMAEEMEDAGKG